jgi:radical SAM superfamily enzyme YgiQ (UPF0313 family)
MKVMLVYPRIVHRYYIEPSWTPLGLPYIAAALRREGHSVSIFDRFACQARVGMSADAINSAMLQHMRDFKPDLIGLNTISPLIYDTVDTVNLIRQSYNGILVAGGHHVTAIPELSLRKIPGLDGVAEGEGEVSLARLCGGEDPSHIPGIWWRDGDNIVHTPPQQIKDLDSLPFPALDLLDMDFYLRPTLSAIGGHFMSVVSMLTSRGCTQRCDFCTESLTYGRGVRFHSVDYVLEQMGKIIKDYNVKGIYFHDNDFLISEDRARQICERILSKGLHKKVKWCIQARTDRINGDILKLLKSAGCIKIELGVEASSQKDLNGVHKGSSVIVNEEAIRLCKDAGISVHAYMITRLEGEEIPDLDNRMRWVKGIKPSTFFWSNLSIHPGTALYLRRGDSYFENNDWTRENIIDFYEKDRLSAVSPDERERWMKRHYDQYTKWHKRLYEVMHNSPLKVAYLILRKIKRQIRKLAVSVFH